ncbi:MAG: hypothetical protein M3P83_11165 [Actinomycetota bacterium]|nr:hypothetical protein [Actinomycetota bacterium]
MLGPLPRLHRWMLLGVCAVTGAVLGAWLADRAATGASYSCSDVLAGVCLAPTVNLVPVLAGLALGLLVAFVLGSRPQRPPTVPRNRTDPPSPPR